MRLAARTVRGSVVCLAEILLEAIRQHGATAEARRHERIFGRHHH